MPPVQFIKTPDGGELAVLDRADYEALLAAAREAEEDEADLAAFDEAMAADPKWREPLPADVTAAMLKGASLLKALRKAAGLTQTELSALTGLGQGYLSEIEAIGSKKRPSPAALAALAKALNVDPEWLTRMKAAD